MFNYINYCGVAPIQADIHFAKPARDSNATRKLEAIIRESEELVSNHDYDQATLLLENVDVSTITSRMKLQRVADLRSTATNGLTTQEYRAANYFGLAQIYSMLGDGEQAINYCKEALQIAQQENDDHLQCETLDMLGILHLKLGRFDRAIDYYKQSLVAAEHLNEMSRISRAYSQLASALSCGGRVDEAASLLRYALELVNRIDDTDVLRRMRMQLGYYALCLGNVDEALQCYCTALKSIQRAHNRRDEGWCRAGLGAVYMAYQDYDRSRNYLEGATRIATADGDDCLFNYATSLLAQLLVHDGALQEAAEVIIRIKVRNADPYIRYMRNVLQSLILARLGKPDESKRLLSAAMRFERNSPNGTVISAESQCLRALARIILALLERKSHKIIGHLVEAQNVLIQAFKDSSTLGTFARYLHLIEDLRPLDKFGMTSLATSALHDNLKNHLHNSGVFVELHVTNFDVAIEFYGKLGFVVVWKTQANGGYLTMRRGSSVVNFYGGSEIIYSHDYFGRFPPTTQRGYGVEIVIPVQDIEAEYESICQGLPLGSVVETLALRPWGQKDFRMVDPFGFYLRFTEPVNWLEPY